LWGIGKMAREKQSAKKEKKRNLVWRFRFFDVSLQSMNEKITNPLTQRAMDWDYRQPAIYMLTLTLAERQPLLGRLVIPEVNGEAIPEMAIVEPTEIGKMALRVLKEWQAQQPELKVLQYQLMPDHLHIALQVKEATEQPLSKLLQIYKRQTEKQARELSSTSIAAPSNQSSALHWAPSFNDNRLRTRGQLQAMIAYIQDNPRRLALRRLRPELLRIRRSELYAGLSFDAVGNMELLQRPKKAVHVRSCWTAEEKRAYKNGCILAARQGAVLVGAFVSDDEKAVKRVALQEKLPLILLQENGFPELYKPSGELFDACAEGRLLLLAPWPYHTRRQTITREQCQLLNQMVERIAELT